LSRRPTHRRTAPKEQTQPPAGVDLSERAASARYVASAEHKGPGHRFGIQGRLRTDATECPKDLVQDQVETWLRKALREGTAGGGWSSAHYPKYVWTIVDGVVYEARLSNETQGWYHGYPISRAEAPKWLREA